MRLATALLEIAASILLGLACGVAIAIGLVANETARAWVGELLHLIRYGI